MRPCPPRVIGLTLLVGCALASAWCSSSPTAPSATPEVSAVAVVPGAPNDTPTGEAPTTPAPTPTGPTEPTPPVGTGSATISVMGDTGWCGSPAMAPLARLLANLEGLILLAGDLAYPNGSLDDFRRCFHPDFGGLLPRMRTAPGNHEYVTAGASGYFTYFGDAAGPDRTGYHAFRVAAWKVLMLNSSVPLGRGAPQYEWVRQQLQSEPTRCTLAVIHHPFDSSGPNGPNPWLRPAWELMHGLGVDLVVNGHDHLYERFAPVDASQRPDPATGIRQFTVGTGGAALSGRARAAAASELLLSTYGVLRLKLDPALYEWQFLDPAGRVLDRGLNICH